ncbi:helix-turn-helix domain-containing protein [Klebsiella oxytoca]|uniref:helix-turn-helix domain-containing protein n=1 Tax=Klebsiella oxytoca TaxID=571 RepID=UPI001C7F4D8A|nr:helix-turn-helix transcriptional regulator [Klebsiella oxytoca]
MLTNDRGRQVRRARLLRHMKQSHLAELMGVDQATVSRWERGTLALSDGRWSAVLQLLTGPSDSSYDAALKRLVQSSAHKGVRLEKGNYPTLSAFFAQMATD